MTMRHDEQIAFEWSISEHLRDLIGNRRRPVAGFPVPRICPIYQNASIALNGQYAVATDLRSHVKQIQLHRAPLFKRTFVKATSAKELSRSNTLVRSSIK